MSKELIDALEKALVELTKNAIPSYKPPLDDGWIRHTGDVCPVHPRDKVLYTAGGVKYDVEFTAGAIRWDGITHYKVTKKYDPHAENKSPYAKKLVDWSCPLLKGANTNCGELLLVVGGNYATLASNNAISQGGDISRLRLAHTDATPSNWQAYNGENLNLLHEAGFVVQVKYWCVDRYAVGKAGDIIYNNIAAYRVIAIRDGFTHYEVTKAYDPHAKSKSLYAEDALTHKEPWMLWEFSLYENEWLHCLHAPDWDSQLQYRRKHWIRPVLTVTKEEFQRFSSMHAKKLVDWSCPLLKGVNTNFGEWLYARRVYVITINQGGEVQHPATEDLRIAHTDATPSNWQAYNGENLNLLHEAGFVVQLRKCNGVSIYEDGSTITKPLFGESPEVTVHYRVIGIRDGFTYAKEVL